MFFVCIYYWKHIGSLECRKMEVQQQQDPRSYPFMQIEGFDRLIWQTMMFWVIYVRLGKLCTFQAWGVITVMLNVLFILLVQARFLFFFLESCIRMCMCVYISLRKKIIFPQPYFVHMVLRALSSFFQISYFILHYVALWLFDFVVITWLFLSLHHLM